VHKMLIFVNLHKSCASKAKWCGFPTDTSSIACKHFITVACFRLQTRFANISVYTASIETMWTTTQHLPLAFKFSCAKGKAAWKMSVTAYLKKVIVNDVSSLFQLQLWAQSMTDLEIASGKNGKWQKRCKTTHIFFETFLFRFMTL